MNTKTKTVSLFLLGAILVVGTISMSTIKSFATIAILPDVDEISPLSCNNINMISNTLTEENAAAAAAGNDQGATDDTQLLGALPGTNMQTDEPQDVVQDNNKKSNSNGNGQDQILEQQLKQKSIFNVCQNTTPNAVSGGDTTQSTQSEQEMEMAIAIDVSNEG